MGTIFRCRCVLAAVLLATGLLFTAKLATAQFVFEIVALERQQAPDVPVGERYFAIGVPSLSDAGDVLFSAVLLNPNGTVSPDSGFWAGRPGSLRLVVREADAAVGTMGDVNHRFLLRRAINRFGDVVFDGELEGADVTLDNRFGVWVGNANGTIELLARTGDPAPGTESGTVFQSFGTGFSQQLLQDINEAGEVPFIGILTNPDVTLANRNGVWSGAPGQVSLVARTGDPAPGTLLNFGGFRNPFIGDDGQVAFEGSVSTGQGIWLGPPDSLSLLALTGTPAPGTAGATFRAGSSSIGFPGLRMNDVGQVAFRANLAGGDVETALGNFNGFWIGGLNDLTLAVRGGDAVPGVTGATFQTPSFLDFNDQGEVAFRNIIRGPGVDSDNANNTGIWMGPPDDLRLVARASDLAPGTGGEVFQNGFNAAIQGFNAPLVNNRGEVAFAARSVPAGATFPVRKGIWVGRPGDLRLLVRVGDMLEVTPGVTREVLDLELPNDTFRSDFNARNQRGFNDAGQVLFLAEFADSSTSSGSIDGLFLATPLNQAPVASAGSVTAEGRVATAINLNANDPDGDTLSFQVVSGPANGLLLGSASSQNRSYTSNPGFLGTDSFTFKASDGVADSNIATVTITVVDTTPPALTAPADVTAEATGTTTEVDLGSATAVDLVEGAIAATNDAPAAGFLLGTTEVTWTAVDSSGNSATAIQLVTVEDTTPPELSVPLDITIEATAVLTVVEIGQATASDIFPVAVVSDAPAGGFSLGTTTVTWTATDANGNQATATQSVTIVDTTAPVVTAPADITAEANAVLSSLDIGQAVASDIFPVTIVNDAPAGFPLGTTTVTWTATDSSGNTAIAAQSVTVVDTTPPALTVPPDLTVEATGPLTLVGIGAATATDIFPVTIVNDGPASYPLGTTAVTWTATDANGNAASATQRITVVDTTPPTVVAALDPIGSGDDDDDDDEGRFRVRFAVSDLVDPTPTVVSVLIAGKRRTLSVADGQVVEFEREDEDIEIEREGRVLEIEAPSLTLRVTATDFSGNTGEAEAEPIGLMADNDSEGPGDDDD